MRKKIIALILLALVFFPKPGFCAFRKSKLFGQAKPPVGAQVDWGDPISNGLTAIYLFNEGSGLKAKSLTNQFNGSLINSPSWAAGKFGSGINFNGTNDYVDLGNPLLGSSFTLAMWVNINTLAGNKQFMGTYQSIGGGWLWRTSVFDSTKIEFYDGAANNDSPSVLSTGTWAFIVVTRAGGNYNFYFNGQLILNQSGSAPVTNANVRIADIPESDTVPGVYDLDGKIDNVRIYLNRGLSASEVMRLYQEPFAGIISSKLRIRSTPAAPPATGLAVYRIEKQWGPTKPNSGAQIKWGDPINKDLKGLWLQNEQAGLTVYDLAQKNNGTLTNGPVWTAGKFGPAIKYDGSNDATTFGDVLPMSGRFSVSVWAKPTTGYANGSSVVNRAHLGGTNDQNYWIYISLGSPDHWTFQVSSSNTSNSVNGGTVVANQWYHLVATYVDGTHLKLYVNGVLVGSGGNGSAAGSASPETLSFGWYDGNTSNNQFTGSIDNVRIYSRDLSASEVMRLYQEPFAGIDNQQRYFVLGTSAGNTNSAYPFVGLFTEGAPSTGVGSVTWNS